MIKRAATIIFLVSMCSFQADGMAKPGTQPTGGYPAQGAGAAQEHPAEKSQAKTLTNSDVVVMVSAGLADTTIILDIQTSPTAFDTSPQALVFLQRSSVSQAVIDAMLLAGKGQSGAHPPPPAPEVSAPTTGMPPRTVPVIIANSKTPKPDMHKIRKVYLEMDWAEDEKARPRAIETLKKRTCLKVVDSLDEADARLKWTNQGLMGVDVQLSTKKDEVEFWSGRSFVNPLRALRRDLGCE